MEHFGIAVTTVLVAMGCLHLCVATQDMGFPTLDDLNSYSLRTMLKEDTGADTFDAFAQTKQPRAAFSSDGETCGNLLGRKKCMFLKSNFACHTHPKRMSKLCGLTCGLCVSKKTYCQQSRFGCCDDGKTIATGPGQKGCKSFCVDKAPARLCQVLKTSGQCTLKSAFMQSKCSATCGYCRPCMDEKPLKCKYLTFYNKCSVRKQDAMNYCRKSCGFCGVFDICQGHPCQKGYKCMVNSDLKPTCTCDFECSEAEQSTGIVCGRDGIEYKNICAMKHALCGAKYHISAKHFGKCNKYSAIENVNCSMKEYSPTNCALLSKQGMCESNTPMMGHICPHTCGFCKVASERFSCFRSVHGCCLDGKTQCQGPMYVGCPDAPACSDRYKTLCKRFSACCGNPKNQNFMKTYCPQSCNYCNKWKTP